MIVVVWPRDRCLGNPLDMVTSGPRSYPKGRCTEWTEEIQNRGLWGSIKSKRMMVKWKDPPVSLPRIMIQRRQCPERTRGKMTPFSERSQCRQKISNLSLTYWVSWLRVKEQPYQTQKIQRICAYTTPTTTSRPSHQASALTNCNRWCHPINTKKIPPRSMCSSRYRSGKT